ncbi:MAG: phosphotransferase family protein [Rhodobiaceae bacterium]|nr:phosphotransferase family protein [Rhodobiaceae bacterium]
MVKSIDTAATTDVRDNPTPEFIEEMRRRFPTERETDALLVRKLQRRSGPPYRHVTLDEMAASLDAMLRHVIGSEFEVTGLKWLTGGASKIQMAFMLTWTDSEGGRRQDHLVLRMDPSEPSNSTSRVREVELIRAFEGIVPVPKVYWLDANGDWFPEPAIIYSFVPGVTKQKTQSAGKVIGLGTMFSEEMRQKLAPQFLANLAAIHTADIDAMSLTSMDRPTVGTTESARWQLNRARRVWEEDRGEDFPLMDVAVNWLERELPVLDHLSVVHGDYRSGNFLFDEDSGSITAILDWERGHLGDRHRDLAWMTRRAMGHFGADGKTYYVCGLIPLDEFYERYEKASGLSVDMKRVTYYRILNCFQSITTTVATAYRVSKLAKSHQDVLLSRLKAVSPINENEMAEMLEGAM